MRKKHASGGQSGESAARLVLTENNYLGAGDVEPMQRPRSTSLGAKDRLRKMKEMRTVGAPAADKTIMGQLISNGLSSRNGQSSTSSLEKVSGMNPLVGL